MLLRYIRARYNFYPRPPRGGRRIHPHRRQCHRNFYPRPPRGGRLRIPDKTQKAILFLSTPSARRATQTEHRQCAPQSDFYPRPPRGGRRLSRFIFIPLVYFYPRPPRGGRQPDRQCADSHIQISIHALREEGDSESRQLPSIRFTAFLSTPSARRATFSPPFYPIFSSISIHALREEGDTRGSSVTIISQHFYPRPPRGGRLLQFLNLGVCFAYFYPRPPRGGRLWAVPDRHQRRRISIHALREEGDAVSSRQLSRWPISIHALREEGDVEKQSSVLERILFLSTPSARRATVDATMLCTKLVISIHALREEGDGHGLDARLCDRGFLSTPSARRATWHRFSI